MKLDAQAQARALELLQDPANEQDAIDLLTKGALSKGVGGDSRPIPLAAWAALERVTNERRARGMTGPVYLRVDSPLGDPGRPVEWSVIVDGVVVESSQPHLIGRRRSA